MAEPVVLGIGELAARFRALGTGMEQRVSRLMVSAGGRVLKAEAKALAIAHGHRKTGAMVNNIAIKREAAAPLGTAQYHLGVRNGHSLTRKQKANVRLVVGRNGRIAKRYQDNPFYWRFVALGTKHIQADDFLGQALANQTGAAVDAMGQRLTAELEKTSPTAAPPPS